MKKIFRALTLCLVLLSLLCAAVPAAFAAGNKEDAFYTIGLDACGGVSSTVVVTTNLDGKLTTLPESPTMDGYTFNGWYTEPVGDTFTITVLDRELTYEVDKISIVLPTEVDELKVVDGKDYVTLMTCTPYGINTHRLLVRGHRVTAPENLKRIRVAADATRIEPILIAPLLAVPLLLLLLIGLLVSGRKRKQK
jgi:uncharacterized repeat protein (TIGR02543 family)